MAKLYSNRGIRFIQALQHRAFTWFWAGQTISTLGDGAFTTALAVVVYQLTKSSLAMGLILMAQITPEVIFTLIGGAVADRLPRRTVLLASDASRALIVLSIALLGWLNLLHLWHLFAMAILFGITLSFFHPSYRALTPELVPKEHFSSANALTELSIQLGNLLGPALGAGLIALAAGSTAAAFAFDGLTFVISVCSLLIMRSTPPLSQQTPSLAQKRVTLRTGLHHLGKDIREGFHTILASTWLLWSMIVAAIALMSYKGAISVALPKLVFAIYGSGPWLLAAISTAVAIGAIIGALFVGEIKLRRRGVISLLGYVLSGLALMTFAFPLPHTAIIPFFVLPAAFLVGFGINVMQTIWVTLLYELVPPEKLGRVSSVDLLGSLGLLPIGYLLAGWLGDRLGPPTVFLFGGAFMVVVNLIPLLFRDIRQLQ